MVWVESIKKTKSKGAEIYPDFNDPRDHGLIIHKQFDVCIMSLIMMISVYKAMN